MEVPRSGGIEEEVVEFTITALNGDSVRVESDNWLIAMGKALGFFDVEPDAVVRLQCSRAEDGSVEVREEVAGLGWFVRAVEGSVSVSASSRSQKEQWAPIHVHKHKDDFDPSAPAPDLSMPDPTLQPQDAETIAERLFDLSMEIDAMSEDQAADAALDIARGATAAESAVVALGTLDQPHLRVVAARGTGAARIFGRSVNFGEGLVGMCFDMSDVIVVHDVDAGTPHVDPLGDEGHTSLSVLCVPLVDEDFTARGVIQLLNPASRPFLQSDVDVVQTVAKALAQSLSNR